MSSYFVQFYQRHSANIERGQRSRVDVTSHYWMHNGWIYLSLLAVVGHSRKLRIYQQPMGWFAVHCFRTCVLDFLNCPLCRVQHDSSFFFPFVPVLGSVFSYIGDAGMVYWTIQYT